MIIFDVLLFYTMFKCIVICKYSLLVHSIAYKTY